MAERVRDTSPTARENLAGLIRDMDEPTFGQLLAKLPEDDRPMVAEVRERARAAAFSEGWRANPYTMARHLEGDAFADYAFARLLGERFADAVEGRHRLQIWNTPAQLGKSTVAHRCLAWALDRAPQDPFIYTSYGDNLAVKGARFVRDYSVRYGDQLRYRLRRDASQVGEWLTTEGGGLKATGIRGGLSGFPAAGILIDDPHKNWQEAHSEAEQEEVWELFRAVLRLRLRMGGFIIILHTRWAEKDLSGRVLEYAQQTGEEWLHVQLPMLARAPDPEKGIGPDPLGRAPGEPLEPRRFDVAACHARAAALGSYLADALESQDPQPAEGGILKRAWWTFEDQAPSVADEWLSSWDMKLKDVATGDFVVGQVFARVGSRFHIVEQFRGQWTQRQVKVAVVLAAHRWPACRRHVLENTGNGPEVMRELRQADPDFTLTDEDASAVGCLAEERAAVEAILRRGVPGLVPNMPKGDKKVRAIAVSPYLEARNVVLVRAPWNETLVGECAGFPKGTHDDCVDAWSQGLAIITKTAGTTSVVSAAGRSLTRPAPGSPIGPGSVRRPAGPAGRSFRG